MAPAMLTKTLSLGQGCVEASTKDCAAKAHSALLPAAASAANDPTPAAREAALEVLAAFARKAGSMRPVDKACPYVSASCTAIAFATCPILSANIGKPSHYVL